MTNNSSSWFSKTLLRSMNSLLPPICTSGGKRAFFHQHPMKDVFAASFSFSEDTSFTDVGILLIKLRLSQKLRRILVFHQPGAAFHLAWSFSWPGSQASCGSCFSVALLGIYLPSQYLFILFSFQKALVFLPAALSTTLGPIKGSSPLWALFQHLFQFSFQRSQDLYLESQ